MQASDELEELRVHLERIRTLLETLVVRGLRACGPDELVQIRSFAEHLERCGAARLASLLSELGTQIERDDRASAGTLLETQTNVRLLERLLTLRVVKGYYAAAIEARELLAAADDSGGDSDDDSEDDIDEDGDAGEQDASDEG